MEEVSKLLKELLESPSPESLYPEVRTKSAQLLRGEVPDDGFSSTVVMNACCMTAIAMLAKKINTIECAIFIVAGRK